MDGRERNDDGETADIPVGVRSAHEASDTLFDELMLLLTLIVALAWQAADPHRGAFTDGTGRRCASCHDKANPRAADSYRAAAAMSKMVTALNQGPLKPFGRISCFSCHRGGGPDKRMAHPEPLNRSTVRAMTERWPGDARDPEPLRRRMSEYSVSLGVGCEFCHMKGNWKATDKQLMKTTVSMAMMMNEFPRTFSFAGAAAFTCFTCHQGAPKVPAK